MFACVCANEEPLAIFVSSKQWIVSTRFIAPFGGDARSIQSLEFVGPWSKLTGGLLRISSCIAAH